MRINLKVIALIIIFCSALYAEEPNNNEEQNTRSSTTTHKADTHTREKDSNGEDDDRRGATMIQAPLPSELVKVYKGSEKVGKKAGKNTKNFFCSELGWSFFCKGGE